MSNTVRMVGRSDLPTDPNATQNPVVDLSSTQTKQVTSVQGRVFGVLISTQPTGAVSFYDGTDNTGPLIGYVPANQAAGTFVQFLDGGMPFWKGLYVSGATTIGKFTIAAAY